MLEILTLAKELSASVIASTSASSKALTPLKKLSVSRCFGVSNSTITVGFWLTSSVMLGSCLSCF